MTLASKKRPTARLHDTAFYPNRIGDADSCQKSSCKTESAPLLPTNYVVLHRPASIGLAASTTLNTTVMPFVLRGVSLLGIDSGYIGEPYRQRVWQRLATDMRPRNLLEMTRTIGLNELPDVFDGFLKGAAHGRVVVAVS